MNDPHCSKLEFKKSNNSLKATNVSKVRKSEQIKDILCKSDFLEQWPTTVVCSQTLVNLKTQYEYCKLLV